MPIRTIPTFAPGQVSKVGHTSDRWIKQVTRVLTHVCIVTKVHSESLNYQYLSIYNIKIKSYLTKGYQLSGICNFHLARISAVQLLTLAHNFGHPARSRMFGSF